MTDQIITSLQNDQVKTLVKLRQRKTRDQLGLTIIEEPLVIERAHAAGHDFKTVYHCPDFLEEGARDLLGRLRRESSAEIIQLASHVMAKASYRDQPEGLLVVAPQVRLDLADLDPACPGPLVVLESVEKPGNLGAVLRIADGAGAAAVLICGQGTDLFNPNVLRASRGAFFSVPTVEASSDDILSHCKTHGITTVATSPDAPSRYTEAKLSGRIALILGTEHDGLSPEMLAACDSTVSIPMQGAADSLNVASSAAVLLYEALRQRNHS
jgi:TrmH family RNA methyltransferase